MMNESLLLLFRSSSVVEHSAVNRAVVGSNPTCGAIYGELSEWSKEHDWKSCRRDERLKGSNPLLSASHLGNDIWPVGQVVKTPPFHGGNTGSNPVRVIFWRISSAGRALALQARGRRFDPVILHHMLLSRGGAAR